MQNTWISLHLIANHLNDIHYALSQKVLNAPRHKPKFAVSSFTVTDKDTGAVTTHQVVDELEALKILLDSLRTLAQQQYALESQVALPLIPHPE